MGVAGGLLAMVKTANRASERSKNSESGLRGMGRARRNLAVVNRYSSHRSPRLAGDEVRGHIGMQLLRGLYRCLQPFSLRCFLCMNMNTVGCRETAHEKLQDASAAL